MPIVSLLIFLYLKTRISNCLIENLSKLFIIMSLLYGIYNLDNSNTFNINVMTFNAVIVLLYCLFYYYHTLITINLSHNIIRSFDFWFFTGLFIWVTFFLFRMILISYFYNHSVTFFKSINNVFTVVNIITYLFNLYGLRCLAQMKL